LQAAIDDQSSTNDLIKAKLDAYRAAYAKAASDLTAAQADLQSLLTQRQEAALVLSSILN
jgi:phage terminase Nu1 subunit (DNA packaging protein)